MDALEEIYVDPNFPIRTPVLSMSLQQSGKSRADLWAFAALVATDQLFKRNNENCEIGEGLYDTMPQAGVECKVQLTQPLRFFTGRRDCPHRPTKIACPMECYRNYGNGSVDVPGCRAGFYSCSADDTCALETC